jgi:cytochrome c-type biogenesis protein CcmH/NrfG
MNVNHHLFLLILVKMLKLINHQKVKQKTKKHQRKTKHKPYQKKIKKKEKELVDKKRKKEEAKEKRMDTENMRKAALDQAKDNARYFGDPALPSLLDDPEDESPASPVRRVSTF